MQTDKPLFSVTRRRFAFWVGFGLFSVGEKLHARGFDELAAAAMRGAGQEQGDDATSIPEHWRAAENRTWRWFEREHLIDGQWKSTGLTTPIHKRTGEAYSGHTGYLDIDLVPAYLRLTPSDEQFSEEQEEEFEAGEPRPDPVRQARHGRPPSKWLRSLHAAELRLWLRTIRVPEAGV